MGIEVPPSARRHKSPNLPRPPHRRKAGPCSPSRISRAPVASAISTEAIISQVDHRAPSAIHQPHQRQRIPAMMDEKPTGGRLPQQSVQALLTSLGICVALPRSRQAPDLLTMDISQSGGGLARRRKPDEIRQWPAGFHSGASATAPAAQPPSCFPVPGPPVPTARPSAQAIPLPVRRLLWLSANQRPEAAAAMHPDVLTRASARTPLQTLHHCCS